MFVQWEPASLSAKIKYFSIQFELFAQVWSEVNNLNNELVRYSDPACMQYRFEIENRIITYFSDQLFQFIRFCSVPFHNAPDSDERYDAQNEEDETHRHVDQQRHEHQQRPEKLDQFIEYSGDLKSDLVWISNGPKQVGLQMVWILNGIWNPEAQTFEIRTNGRHFVKNHLKTGPFEIRPSKSPDFKCFRISNGRISDPHCSPIGVFLVFFCAFSSNGLFSDHSVKITPSDRGAASMHSLVSWYIKAGWLIDQLTCACTCLVLNILTYTLEVNNELNKQLSVSQMTMIYWNNPNPTTT